MFDGSWGIEVFKINLIRHKKVSVDSDNTYFKCVVKKIVNEAPGINSYYLRPLRRHNFHVFSAGQYIRVKEMVCNQELIRAYTLSDYGERGYYRITIKKKDICRTDQLSLSNYIVDNWIKGSVVNISSPRGDFCLKSPNKPICLIAAGIGVTPILALAKQLIREKNTSGHHIFLNFRNSKQTPFSKEITYLKKYFSVQIGLSQPSMDDIQKKCFDTTGRITIDKIIYKLTHSSYEFYICGPEEFNQDVVSDLLLSGVSASSINVEFFSKTKKRIIGASDRYSIQFDQSNKQAHWNDKYGSLLDLAEHFQVNTRANCRQGVCDECVCQLVSGSVEHDMKVSHLQDGQVMLCSARPLSDVVINI